MFSTNLYRNVAGIVLSAIIIWLAYLLQITILNHFAFRGTMCNLPLTITVLWGYIFGSTISNISTDEIRTRSAAAVFLHQVAGGSINGLLVGAFVAALYHSALPIYPICYPVIGWVAGYVKLGDLNQDTLMCIPLTLLATIFAEGITAWQLSSIGRSDTLLHMSQFVISEAVLNALIAPFIYFPMRRWFEYYHSNPMEN